MQFIQERRRLVLLVLVILVLLCLVGALLINQYNGGGGGGVAADTPTPPSTATEEGPVVVVTPEEEATATPTRVVGEGESSEEPAPGATEVTSEPTAELIPVPTATSSATDADFVPAPPSESSSTVLQTGDILQNGGFEGGFDDQGVGMDWQPFTNGGAIVSFSDETIAALIQAGSNAQRISVDQANQADRYAGIYQTLRVVPDRTYTFTIYGQTRTFFGDVNKSSFGYRVQYAVDYNGGDDWQQIPAEDWVELPWSEEAIDASSPTLSEYSVEITPTSNRMTLFIRVWNKWPDPGLVEYTLDSLSLVGPVPGTAIARTTSSDTTTTEETMIDQPLPVTGTEDMTSFMGDARFWGGIVVLLLLGVGAIYRARWRW